MVNDGSVSGVLDWEFSGWYPEYWEFSKALYIWKWQNDWTDYLVQILQPSYAEYAVFDKTWIYRENVWGSDCRSFRALSEPYKKKADRSSTLYEVHTVLSDKEQGCYCDPG